MTAPDTPVLATSGHVWSEQEKGVLARAASRACPCGGERPWELRVHGPRVEIAPRPPVGGPDDPTHRGRVLACGCALAVLTGAMRVLGWLPDVTVGATSDHGDPALTLTAVHRHRPSSTEVRHFRALFAHTRHEEPLDPTDSRQLSTPVREEILRAAATREVRVVPVPAIVPAHRKRGVDPGLLVVTTFDGRRGQLLAGVAMQRAWLAAVDHGMTAEPLLEPFAAREFRQRMARHAGVDGSPQVLLVVGSAGRADDAGGATAFA